MSQPDLVKAYGALWPTSERLAFRLGEILSLAFPPKQDAISLEGDLARISFEGVYLPVEELIEILRDEIDGAMQGKLDVLDLENWRLTRWEIRNGKIEERSAPLNNVLDYSGH